MTTSSPLPPAIKKELLLARAAIERAEFAQMTYGSLQKPSWILGILSYFFNSNKSNITQDGAKSVIWLELLSLLNNSRSCANEAEGAGKPKSKRFLRFLKLFGVAGLLVYLQLR